MKYLIPTSSAEHLGRRINEEIERLGIPEAKVLFTGKNKDGQRLWPDDEPYSRIPEAKQELFNAQEVIFLHSGQPRPCERLEELRHNLRILKHYSCCPLEKKIFFAHFPYGKQDRVFEEGETAVAEDIYDELKEYWGIQRLYLFSSARSNVPCELNFCLHKVKLPALLKTHFAFHQVVYARAGRTERPPKAKQIPKILYG